MNNCSRALLQEGAKIFSSFIVFGFTSSDIIFLASGIIKCTLSACRSFTSGRFSDVLSQFVFEESSSNVATIDAGFSFGNYACGLIWRDGAFLGDNFITSTLSDDLFHQAV